MVKKVEAWHRFRRHGLIRRKGFGTVKPPRAEGFTPYRGLLRRDHYMSFPTVDPRHSVLRWFAIVLVLLTWGPSVAGKKNKYVAYTIVPAVGDSQGTSGPQKIQILREGVSAEISYVTGVTRRRMMTATLGLEYDPFATPSGMEPRYHTFLISLENTSERVLFFNPSTSRMVNNTNKVSYPLDYTALYQDIVRAGSLTLKQLHQVIYDRSLDLNPGAKAKKLLVFEGWSDYKWETFTLGLTLDVDGLSVVELSLPFRKELLATKKKGRK